MGRIAGQILRAARRCEKLDPVGAERDDLPNHQGHFVRTADAADGPGRGDVFDKDFIESWIDLKMAEVKRFEMTPHPVEFDMYYSV